MQPQKVLEFRTNKEKIQKAYSGHWLVTEKIDGIYGYMDCIAGQFMPIKTSTQRILPSLTTFSLTIDKQLAYIKDSSELKGKNFRLIFEISIPNLPFAEVWGRLNRTVNAYQETECILYLHDIIIFKNLDMRAIDRATLLRKLFKDSLSFRVLPVLLLHSDLKVIENYSEAFMEGNPSSEGVVIKATEMGYFPNTRNFSLCKIKRLEHRDLLCIDIKETIGKKGNSNINLCLQRKNGVIIEVRLGRDEDCFLARNNPYNFVNKVIEIKCMKELSSGMFREPRFSRVRPDKDVNDID